MKLDTNPESSQLGNILYHDNNALNQIKSSRDDKAAIEAVAGQFEAMFLQMVLRQMRSSSDVLADKDNPFVSKQQGMFLDMYDGQLAIELAKKQSSGIANLLVQQLSPSMREVELTGSMAIEPANEIKFSPIGLAPAGRSPHDNHAEQSVNSAINVNAEAVASVKQVLNEVGMTTAFSQPLVRKMEL
ncbi:MULTISPECIES: rod-binding protein [unclassified Vibrio]|uniref:rod-binding protein n=1 Tax=unclassified Vibrio TaxID=2614977 RepID=UPI0014832E6B|nr:MULTISPECIES: rod-binding protein [unclassified Vibrio]NNN44323.1 flagellar protein [Vibrio sp. 1-1(7)]NNN72839.1 flagellar protein [Vibrio sp. 12-2(3-a)]